MSLLRTVVLGTVAAAALLATAPARANPHTLVFTYPWETLPKGSAEVEQYVDVIPLRVFEAEGSKTTVVEPRFELTTEFEYGITDRLEFAFYLAMKNAPEEAGAGAPLAFDGIKQRLRYRIADENQLPVDISLYLEVAEMHDEIELEEKINLQKRFGRLKAMVNLWTEQEFSRDGTTLILHPTGGLSYQVTPTFSVGAEYWMRAEFELGGEAPKTGSVESFNLAPHHFVGPNIALTWGRLWWAVGGYARLDGLMRAMRPGEDLGHIYVRSIIGLSL